MVQKVVLLLFSMLSLPATSQTLSELKKAVNNELKNAEISIYTSGKPKESGVLFCVEVHASFSDGSTVIVNEEGSYTKYEGLFEYEVTGARSAFSSSESPIFYFDYCENVGQNAIRVKVRPIGGTDWIVDEQISYNCFIDPSIEEERLVALQREREKEEREQEKTRKENEFQEEVATFNEKERAYAQKLITMGYAENLREAQEEVIQVRRRKEVLKSVQYWKFDPPVSIEVGNKNKKYAPKSADTLHYFNEQHKNLGIIFDGERLIRLTSYTNDEEADENGSVLSSGSQLFEHKASMGYESVAGAHNAHTLDYRTKANIVQYHTLESGGFIVVSLDLITIYNDDLSITHEIVAKSRIEGNKFLDAIRIPNSEDFAVLFTNLSGQAHVARYYSKTKSLSKNWLDVTVDVDNISRGTGIKFPFTNRIFKADDSSFAVFLNRRGAGLSEVSKFQFSDLEAPTVISVGNIIRTEPIWTKSWYSIYFLSMSRLPNGNIMILCSGDDYDDFHGVGEVTRNDLDIRTNSKEEFLKSLVSHDEIIDGFETKYFYPQKDGSLFVLKREVTDSDYSSQFLLHRYNANFEFVTTYKLPLPFLVELAIFQYGINSNLYIYKKKNDEYDHISEQLRSRIAGRDYNSENNKYTYRLKDGQISAASGVSFEVFEEAKEDVTAKDYFWNLQSLDFSLDPNGNFLYMITPTTLQKIDLEHVVVAKPFSLNGDEYD